LWKREAIRKKVSLEAIRKKVSLEAIASTCFCFMPIKQSYNDPPVLPIEAIFDSLEAISSIHIVD